MAGSEGAGDPHGHGTPYGGGGLRRLLRSDEEEDLPDTAILPVISRVVQGICTTLCDIMIGSPQNSISRPRSRKGSYHSAEINSFQSREAFFVVTGGNNPIKKKNMGRSELHVLLESRHCGIWPA